MHIAAVQPDRMGDVMFSWPILAKIKDRFQAEITLFIHEDSEPLTSLIQACPIIDKVQVFSCALSWQNDSPEELKRLPLFAEFDSIFNFTHLPGWLSPNAGDFRSQDRHMIDFNAYQASEILGEEINLIEDERVLPLRVIPEKEEKRLKGDYIVLACWSKDERRCWDITLWEKLISVLGFPCYAIGGLGEKCPRGAVSLLGKTNTYEYAQIVQNAKLFISVETFGTSMLAEALGTPIVKIHNSWDHVFNLHPLSVGPGNPNWSGWRFTIAKKYEGFSSLEDVVEAANYLLMNYDKKQDLIQNRYITSQNSINLFCLRSDA